MWTGSTYDVVVESADGLVRRRYDAVSDYGFFEDRDSTTSVWLLRRPDGGLHVDRGSGEELVASGVRWVQSLGATGRILTLDEESLATSRDLRQASRVPLDARVGIEDLVEASRSGRLLAHRAETRVACGDTDCLVPLGPLVFWDLDAGLRIGTAPESDDYDGEYEVLTSMRGGDVLAVGGFRPVAVAPGGQVVELPGQPYFVFGDGRHVLVHSSGALLRVDVLTGASETLAAASHWRFAVSEDETRVVAGADWVGDDGTWLSGETVHRADGSVLATLPCRRTYDPIHSVPGRLFVSVRGDEEQLLEVETATGAWRVLASAPDVSFEIDARKARIAWFLSDQRDPSFKTSFWAGALP